MIRPRRWALLLVCAAALITYALPYRQPNCNTTSHFALVQMLAAGNRTIDAIHGQSCDISWSAGHFYSNKAPGLALVTLPWYTLLRSVHALSRNPAASAAFPRAMRSVPRRDLWLMGIWGAILPALASLLIAYRIGERFEPRSGVLVAASLGLSTLLLPFASLFFSHALAACITLGAFALVVGNRRPELAGALAGFGIVVEYPLALLVVALGASFLVRSRVLDAARFAAGASLGVAPLVVFNWWAFGSPLHLSYVGAVLVPGVTGHDILGANSAGFFGLGWPHANAAFHVLTGPRGLISVAPVLLLVPVGLSLLWRRGQRLEAGLIAAIGSLFLLYNFSYYSPLGGATPGPRFLVCTLGVSAVALAPLRRVAPFTLCALAIASAGSMLVPYLTQPLISPPYDTRNWWEWLTRAHYTATIISPSAHTWLAASPIAISALGAFAIASASLVPAGRGDTLASTVGVLVWLGCLIWLPADLKSYSALAGSALALALLYAHAQRRQLTAGFEVLNSLSIGTRILWGITALLCLRVALGA